jgi:hypothetical protein
MTYDYIVFNSYYKHGETMTNVYDSFYKFFEKTLHNNMIDFLLEVQDQLDEEESEDESEEEESKNYDIDDDDDLKKYIIYYNKYKKLLPEGRNEDKMKYFKLLTEEIESDEDKLFKEILVMNEYIKDSEWSIRSIIKVKKDSYKLTNSKF